MFFNIEYEQPDVTEYKCVELHYEDRAKQEHKVIFNSGDIRKDWFEAIKTGVFLVHDDEVYGYDAHFVFSSSVGHFISDDEDDIYKLLYLNLDDDTLHEKQKDNSSIYFFVRQDDDFKTIPELKEFVKTL